MRAALLHRLNATRPISACELVQIMKASNCPIWLAQMSVEDLMDELEVRLEGSTLVPNVDEPPDEFFPEKYPQG